MKLKFCEAVEEMNPGDVFSPDSSDYGEFCLKKDIFVFEDGSPIWLSKEHFNLIGQVIPAEPKVLTAKEFADKIAHDF
jgi:hypothetical protein